jgi:hypothetical protein
MTSPHRTDAQPARAYPLPAPTAEPANGLAIAAMIVGIVGRGEAGRRGGNGRGKATAGWSPYSPRTASTDSSVSASAAGLSGRWRITRAKRRATPPG